MNWDEAVLKFQPQTREEAFALGELVGFQKAIDALKTYREDSEEVRKCMHNMEWALWLQSKITKSIGSDQPDDSTNDQEEE
jgi:hypothetical protein